MASFILLPVSAFIYASFFKAAITSKVNALSGKGSVFLDMTYSHNLLKPIAM